MNALTKTALLAGAVGLGAWLVSRKIRREPYSFADKVVLITGGSRGLGFVLARQLRSEGARVAVCARDPAELQRAAAVLTLSGQAPLALPCDVTNAGQV